MSAVIFVMVKRNAISKLKHLGITPSTGKNVKRKTKESAVFDNLFHTDDSASFDDFQTLVKESDEFRLFFRESFLILRNDL